MSASMNIPTAWFKQAMAFVYTANEPLNASLEIASAHALRTRSGVLMFPGLKEIRVDHGKLGVLPDIGPTRSPPESTVSPTLGLTLPRSDETYIQPFPRS
jgi:hypothetical protein